MFKECRNHAIVPFIVTDELKMFYYRGLHEWNHIPEYLTDTCLTAQDYFKILLDYFKIKYYGQRHDKRMPSSYNILTFDSEKSEAGEIMKNSR